VGKICLIRSNEIVPEVERERIKDNQSKLKRMVRTLKVEVKGTRETLKIKHLRL